MASELFDITLKGDSRQTVKKGRIPAGSTFADLERYVLKSMGWDSASSSGFVIPGTKAAAADPEAPVDAYGRMPVEYVHGKVALRVTFTGLSNSDYSGSAFASRRNQKRTEAIRGCLKRWEESLRTPGCLDDATVRKIACAISSSRRSDAYLDLDSLTITDSSGKRSMLIRRKDSPFLEDAEKRFCSAKGIGARLQDGKMHERFLREISRSPKASKAWKEFLEKESRSAAEEWAVANGLRGNARFSDSKLLPCRYCGKELEAREDPTGMPAMADRPRRPMIVRCPDCGKTSRLRVFNDGFGPEYCFEGDSRPCQTSKGLIVALKKAESETDPDRQAEALLSAALEAYRCGKATDAEKCLQQASMSMPEESAVVSAYTRGGASADYDGRCILVRLLSECAGMLSEESFEIISERIDKVEALSKQAGIPEWLVWDLRLSEILALSSSDDPERAYEAMKGIVGSYLDFLSKKGSASSEECRMLCSMAEAAARFSYLRLGPESSIGLLEPISELFSDERFRNPAVTAVVNLRRGIAEMSISEDDEAVARLVSTRASVGTVSGRGPVAGRRAFAAMLALYPYDPESTDLVAIAVNSMNAMTLTGAVSDEEFEELKSAAAKAVKAAGAYRESADEIEAMTNVDLGPEPDDALVPDDIMDLRFSYFIP